MNELRKYMVSALLLSGLSHTVYATSAGEQRPDYISNLPTGVQNKISQKVDNSKVYTRVTDRKDTIQERKNKIQGEVDWWKPRVTADKQKATEIKTIAPVVNVGPKIKTAVDAELFLEGYIPT